MKFRAAALAALLGMGLCGTAQAQGLGNYYLYGDYDHFTTHGNSLNGGGLGLGWNMGRYFGLQLGGQYLKKSGTSFTDGYAEALGILPLGRRLSIDASLGAGFGRVTGGGSKNGSGYRAGVGLDYKLSPRWSIRAGFHRQNVVAVIDDYNLGLSFRF